MKFAYEQLLQIVEDYKKIGARATEIRWGISVKHLYRVLNKYRNNCLFPHKEKKKYPVEFKLEAVLAYENGEGSFSDLIIKYGISNEAVLKSWYDIYQSEGEEGLRNMKKTGRPKKDEVKANKNKVNLDSLLSSDKEDYTKEEIKALKEELLRLRCHEEFSKKFEALAQDYLRKKNSR